LRKANAILLLRQIRVKTSALARLAWACKKILSQKKAAHRNILEEIVKFLLNSLYTMALTFIIGAPAVAVAKDCIPADQCCKVCDKGVPCGDACLAAGKKCELKAKECKTGKPCGDSCIAKDKKCEKREFCACSKADVCPAEPKAPKVGKVAPAAPPAAPAKAAAPAAPAPAKAAPAPAVKK